MNYDVIIVGGGAGGLATALALKSLRPDLNVLIIRRTKLQVIPCAVPYITNTVGSVEGIQIPDSTVKNAGVDLIIDEVVGIDRSKKLIKTASGREFMYKKLVLATGVSPIKLNIPGIEKEGVILISKEYEQLVKAYQLLKDARRIVIVGGSFTGLEFADDLAKGREIHVVEVLEEVLPLCFDKEFGEIARRKLEEKGVKFHLKASVKEIRGKDKVEEIVLTTGEILSAEAVLVAVGVTPNSNLAAKAGLALDQWGHVVVDSFMRSSDPDIYAVGDIAQKRDFFTGKPVKAYFASVAVAEGRVAAMHIAGVATARGFEGALPVFSTYIGGTVLAAAGLTEFMARNLGLDVLPVKVEAVNRHPAALPGGGKIQLKALFLKSDLRLVGVQIAGPEPVGELINYAGAVIQQGLSAYDIVKMNFATQPLLTASPLAYPLQLAALQAIKIAMQH
jgi:NADPH-dependent 2,4-dienoyl-CoA reductase/sulfur reductase-like enzyme